MRVLPLFSIGSVSGAKNVTLQVTKFMTDRQITLRMPQEQLFLQDLVNAAGNLSFEDLGLFHLLERNVRLNS